MLAVNNQSQLSEQLTFSLIKGKGNRLKEEKLDHRGKHKWNDLLDLSPGDYQLIVVEHPEFVCHFSITR